MPSASCSTGRWVGCTHFFPRALMIGASCRRMNVHTQHCPNLQPTQHMRSVPCALSCLKQVIGTILPLLLLRASLRALPAASCRPHPFRRSLARFCCCHSRGPWSSARKCNWPAGQHSLTEPPTEQQQTDNPSLPGHLVRARHEQLQQRSAEQLHLRRTLIMHSGCQV